MDANVTVVRGGDNPETFFRFRSELISYGVSLFSFVGGMKLIWVMGRIILVSVGRKKCFPITLLMNFVLKK